MNGERYHTPAVVCDADKLSQVAIIQELGRLGIPVVAIANSPSAIGFASKYVGLRISCSIPSYEPEYIRFLTSSVPRGVIFYSNDANTENISRHREELLSAGFSVFISSIPMLERVIQKDRLYQTALECGISVPKSCLVSSGEELQRKLPEFGLPVILKSTNLAGGVYKRIATPEAAPAVFREMTAILESEAYHHRGARLMLQQWVPQANVELWNFNACVREGEIVSFSMGQRIRTDVRPDGTLGSILLFGKTAYDDVIYGSNRRLLKHLKFDGLLETEWSKNTTQPGQVYLYDFNPRPSGNIRWTFKSGVSLAELYYRLALGLPAKPQTMTAGVVYAKVFYTQNDLLEAVGNSSYSFPQKLAVLKDDLVAVVRCGHHAVDILDPKDLGPTLRASGQFSSMVIARLRQRARRLLHRFHWRVQQPQQLPR